MSYRYPFTAYPKGWYRIDDKSENMYVFGKAFKIKRSEEGYLFLEEATSGRLFPITKKNDYLYVYYANQESKAHFEVPEVVEFNDRENWQRPFSLTWRTRTHPQEVAENALDMSHFCTVHTYKDIPTLSDFKMNGHQFNVVMHSRKNVFGLIQQTTMDVTYYGLGIVVANASTSYNIMIKVLLTTTPYDEEHVDIRMEVALKKNKCFLINFILRLLFPRHIKKEFSRDFPVWESKVYRTKPLLCKTESNIIQIRKWAAQFYA